MSLPLDVVRVWDEYRVRAPGVSLRFRSVTPHHDGPSAIVECLDTALGGRPHVDRLSLLSSRSRASLAKTLSARWPEHRWSDILDDACHAVDELVSRGEPAVLLEAEPPSPAQADLVDGLIPLDQITVLYADGGSLKSYFALALSLAALRNEPLVSAARWCVRQRSAVLYLDWETDRRTHALRLWRLCQGLEIEPPSGIYYQSMRGRPLHTAIQSVAGEVARVGADLIVVDSLGMACGDEPETALANLRTLGALSSLPATKLVLAHVNAATATSPNGPGRPYGSVFIRNTARSAIEARSEPDGEHGQLVTYYHRKANDGPMAPPTAIRYAFEPGGAVKVYAAQADLQFASLSERIVAELTQSAKTVATLAEILGVQGDSIRKELHRMENRGSVVQVATVSGGRGHSAQWGLALTNRGTLGD